MYPIVHPCLSHDLHFRLCESLSAFHIISHDTAVMTLQPSHRRTGSGNMSVASAVSADAPGIAAAPTADTRSVASDDTEGDFSPKGVFGRAASGLEAHVLEFARDVLLCSSRTVTGGDPFFASELVCMDVCNALACVLYNVFWALQVFRNAGVVFLSPVSHEVRKSVTCVCCLWSAHGLSF